MRKKWLRRTLLLSALAFIAGTALFCSPGFVLRAGIEEAKILSRRQPIPEVIASPRTPEPTRSKLELVRMARTFADRELDLDVGDSYTTYSRVDSDTLLLVVSGSRRDAFRPVTWWFPIVGRVPYKGYFNHGAALAEARRLEAEGYDTHVRPAGAFSTLGFFNDPLLSTVLRYTDVSLAATVIHEVTHNTTYIPSQAAFNESFASFVGDRGAIALFCGVEGEEGERCRAARTAWEDAVVFGGALQSLVADLEAVYGRDDLSSEQKVARRDGVIDAWREDFARDVAPRLRTGLRTFHERPINNATLIGTRLYYDRLELFEEVYRSLGLPFREAIHRMMEAAESSPDDPFGAVARLATG
ncbi:MAG TPA: aminopeptidase [Longimicrobiales bacterium]|nr:aminopeptidase [Longimicrobiales bacterium]